MIKCNGNMLNTTLSDVMYVPWLNRRLFSVTQFAQHGHCTIVQQHGTTLFFIARHLLVTIPHHKNGRTMASNLSVAKPTTNISGRNYHKVPTYRNKDQDRKWLPLELLHLRFEHRKCQTLLAASEHHLWEDTTVRMTGETDCLTCDVVTIRSRVRNKKAHSGTMRVG